MSAGAPRRAAVGALVVALLVSGCGALVEAPPTPTPQPFPGIVGELERFGVTAESWTSGDPGCDDPTLSPTSVRFSARGLDQAGPVVLRIYIFRDREAWERRSADVETCVAAWATDPATVELVSVSPYVLAGQGPWPAQFKDAVRNGIVEAAGNGG